MQEMQIEERESALVIADAVMVGPERRMNATALSRAAAAAVSPDPPRGRKRPKA